MNWLDYMLIQQRRKELLREKHRHLLVQQATVSRPTLWQRATRQLSALFHRRIIRREFFAVLSLRKRLQKSAYGRQDI